MKSVAIVGYGYVGKAMHEFFKDHYDMYVYDPYALASDIPNTRALDLKTIANCDLSVICVPTPRDEETGKCDISIAEEVIKGLKGSNLVLLKSTVEIGTTSYLASKYNQPIVFSPEYCGESTYWSSYKFHTDVKETPFFIFGGHPEYTSKVVDFFIPVAGPEKKYIQTDYRTAELVKYMENSFYAMKIAFCYEIYEICKSADINWNEARELWLLDPRFSPMHTAVFEENDWPFKGKCLPKDISALIEVSKRFGYQPELLKEVIKTNQRLHDIRKKRRDDFKVHTD